MQPDRLDAIKKRIEAYRADPGTPGVLMGPDVTPAAVALLMNTPGDLMWLMWVAEHLLKERRQLFDERDAAQAAVQRVAQALNT